MRDRSKAKVKQVMDLANELHLKVEARERIDEQGFIEKVVFWTDTEKYPSAPAGGTGPTGSTVPGFIEKEGATGNPGKDA